MDTTEKKKCTFQPAAESARLKSRLLEMDVDQLISYQEINEIINENPQKPKGRSIVYAALKALRAENQIVFGCVENEGYKRLSDAEIMESSNADIAGIRKRAGRSSNKLECADPGTLSLSQRVTYHAISTVLSFMRASTSAKRIKTIERAAATKNGVLDLKETLALLG